MNKLVVKDYQKTATEGQPIAPYTIHIDLHSLLPIPSPNTPWTLLENSCFSSTFFLTLSPLHRVDRAALPAEAAVQHIRGQ